MSRGRTARPRRPAWSQRLRVRMGSAPVCSSPPTGLDHMQQLGGTVAEIAREKAGIIKEGRIAVVRDQRTEAMDVIDRRGQDVGATLLVEGRDFHLAERSRAVGGQLLSVAGVHA